jgi:phospholipase/lecithinase/hemolysin
MRKTNFALALLTAAALAACGGNGSSGGDQALKTKFSSQVTFGDSLSDVGTYAVGAVANPLKGGKFTINGDNTATNPALTGKNWTELMAAQFGLPAPCAAVTGLNGDASKGFNAPVTVKAGCTGYAQGGARVSDPVGPGNALTGSPLGQLTYPVKTQIANHLAANGGKFKGDEVVFVMAGGNDVLSLLGQLSADATKAGKNAFAASLIPQLAAGAPNPAAAGAAITAAIQTESAKPGSTDTTVVQAAVTAAVVAGNTGVANPAVYGPMVATAQAAGTAAGNKYAADNGPALVPKMAAYGAELAGLVKTEIVGKGANYVVVNNLPDVASTPSGKGQLASTQTLIAAMVDAFNAQLKAGVAGDAKVLYVDLFTVSHDQVAHPDIYGLTNVTTPACGPNALGTTSLVCNASNTLAGVDVSHYMFADDIHPTPFEYSLVARYVAEQMIIKGWL